MARDPTSLVLDVSRSRATFVEPVAVAKAPPEGVRPRSGPPHPPAARLPRAIDRPPAVRVFRVARATVAGPMGSPDVAPRNDLVGQRHLTALVGVARNTDEPRSTTCALVRTEYRVFLGKPLDSIGFPTTDVDVQVQLHVLKFDNKRTFHFETRFFTRYFRFLWVLLGIVL